MRIEMLTGGGDCPGLNAVIRAVVRKGAEAHRRVMVPQVMGRHAGWIATHAGIAAIDLASAGRWGMMAALRGAEVAAKPIDEATSQIKTVPDSHYRMAEVFSS